MNRPSKRTEGVDETLSLFDALCRLSGPGGLKSILHQLATLTEPYDVKCKDKVRENYFFFREVSTTTGSRA